MILSLQHFNCLFTKPYIRSGYRSSVNLENKLPDNPTIENIREMINRSTAYFKQQEHIIDVGDRLFVKYKGDTIYGIMII